MSSPLPTSDNSACAITGLGLAAGLGLDAESVWRRVRRGEHCFAPMSAMEQPLPAGADGGQAPELPSDFEPTLPREARYLRWTILAALADAGLANHRPYAADRCTLVLGTTLHGMRAGGDYLRTNDVTKLSSFLASDTARLATAGLHLDGGAMTTCSACSSSLGAIALGITLLERGEADLVVAGGYDTISEYAWAGFNALRLVSGPPLRPFAAGRCGMKLAEGYGIVILERLTDADRRDHQPRAIVAGWGESADAHHLTKPHPDGEGAIVAMRQALDRAGIDAVDLDLIAAHATGTPDNDSSEAAAITRLTEDATVPVVGFKSHLGHTLGGAGAVELILSSLAIRDGIIPPTASVSAGDVEYPSLALATGSERATDVRHTLNTSLGFGGANTCVVLSKPGQRPPRRQPARASAILDEACITGIGVIVPGSIGNSAFLEAMRAGCPATDALTIDDAAIESCISARRIRRMSSYVKISLAAATLACRDAGIENDAAALAKTSALLGTTHGSSSYCYDYYAQVVREGVLAANPMLFAEGVPNAAAAQVSLMLGLRGACQTILGTRTAGLDALRMAAARIADGAVQRTIVCAAEEQHWALDAAYAGCHGSRPSVSLAVTFVVESRRVAESRGATIRGLIGDGISRTFPAGAPRNVESMLADAVERGLVGPHANVCRGVWFDSSDAFSVDPLLGIAALLLNPDGPDERLAFAADRTGVASAIGVRRMRTTDASTPARQRSAIPMV